MSKHILKELDPGTEFRIKELWYNLCDILEDDFSVVVQLIPGQQRPDYIPSDDWEELTGEADGYGQLPGDIKIDEVKMEAVS